MVNQRFYWAQQPKQPTLNCADDYLNFARKYLPRGLFKNAIEFSLLVQAKPVPGQHRLTDLREVNEVMWNPVTRHWLERSHKLSYYQKLLPECNPSQVFTVLLKCLALIVWEGRQSLATDE